MLATAPPDVRGRDEEDGPAPGHGVLRRSFEYLTYLVTGLPTAVASFTLLLCGISLSAGLAIVWVGIPLALVTLELARALAHLERSRLRYVGVYVPDRLHETSPHPNLGTWQRSWRLVGDGRAWRELAHGLLVLPLAVVTFSVALIWTVGAAAGLTSWLWWGWRPPTSMTLSELIGLPLAGAWPEVLLGLLLAATAVPVLRICVLLHSGLATALLGDPNTTKELT